MNKLDFNYILNNDIALVENRIVELLPKCNDGQDLVVEAMKYSLVNGGKRLRPVLCMEFANMLGVDRYSSLDTACALEYIHTGSLIHDDLPCMDDDDMRRGKPSCHKQFDEATALLAADALFFEAFDIIAGSDISDSQKAMACGLLAQNSSVLGMIGGQVIDLEYESKNPTLEQLLSVHKLKTGALIAAACLMGCIVGNATPEQMKAASSFAYNLGIAFQIKDDILDVTGNEEVLGKPVGSDADNNKVTYVSIVGLKQAQKDVEAYTDCAIASLSEFENTDFIKTLAEELIKREK